MDKEKEKYIQEIFDLIKELREGVKYFTSKQGSDAADIIMKEKESRLL